MSNGYGLVRAMRKAGQTPQNEVVDLVIGEVTSISPLKVKIENRELTESFLILGALCQETHIYTDNIKKYNHKHSVPDATTRSASSHSHGIDARDTEQPKDGDFDIMLWRGLRIGDRVLMLKVARGQKYYILQREEGVIPT